MIRILIADDHNVVRQGLKLILEKNSDIKVVASCPNGTEAMNWLLENNCDVALIDIAMPGMSGIELLNRIKKVKPKLPVLILSAHPEDQYAVRLIKAGASGYLSKECAPDEVVTAVRNVMAGNKHISPAVAGMLADELCRPESVHPHERLTNREYEIFILIAAGKAPAHIADMLDLSAKTVSTYRARIMEKMCMHNNNELIRYVVDNRLE